MIRFISTGALVSLLLAACVQDGTAMTETNDLNETNSAASETQPVSRGLADIRSEQMQPFLEACDGEAVQRWIGRRFSAASETALLQASGASTLRLVRPGQAISMDYQTDRLTIDLDGTDIILALRCG